MTTKLPVIVAFASIVTASVAAAPAALAQCPSGPPVLQLANPNPGDVLSQGDYIVSGVAFDPAATAGSGVSRVDLFLGQRDSGGVFLTSATPGSGRLFDVKATLPSNANGGRDLVAYAYSSVTGEETSLSVPVFIGAAPTPTPTGSSSSTPVTLTSTTQSSCAGSTTATFRPLPTSLHPGPVLQLANPNPGDVLGTGDIIVEGIAFDASATQGDGVDRVELFLDDRDTGGASLGSGAPVDGHAFKLKATIPTTANGAHTIFAYAHSTVTDQESVTSVPIYIGAAPTPTPRPHS